ncbi:hypothetical protein, partial [Pseudorhodobacter sp.]|uniref:hypothetical protein n=1 Tax=Pseudorhodobacter sp. TaxID=1934400 RepID=UPI0039E258C4
IPVLHGQKTCTMATGGLSEATKAAMSYSCLFHTSLLDSAERKLGLFFSLFKAGKANPALWRPIRSLNRQ